MYSAQNQKLLKDLKELRDSLESLVNADSTGDAIMLAEEIVCLSPVTSVDRAIETIKTLAFINDSDSNRDPDIA